MNDKHYKLETSRRTVLGGGNRGSGSTSGAAGIGAGGYVPENQEPGVHAYMTRNPNYWKSDKAFVDETEILSITDPGTRQNTLASGQVNVIDRVDPGTAHLLHRTPVA